MGGKNALIVDADADPDQAVPGVVASAFGYAGQKCSAASRLIVVGGVYDEIVGGWWAPPASWSSGTPGGPRSRSAR